MNRLLSKSPNFALWLFTAAFLLRAVIPVGYMPAAAGSGLLFELCPAGVSAEFAQFLGGHSEQGHQHGGAEDDSHQCDVGHMLLSAAAVDDSWQLDVATPVFTVRTTSNYSFSSAARLHYHSRGPPA